MKSKRQEKILELIEKYNIETQEELIARLAECGIESKQTTVSRDIKELYLYKEPIGGGRSRYAVSGSNWSVYRRQAHCARHDAGAAGAENWRIAEILDALGNGQTSARC